MNKTKAPSILTELLKIPLKNKFGPVSRGLKDLVSRTSMGMQIKVQVLSHLVLQIAWE